MFQVWAAFVVALAMTAGGLWNLGVPGWVQGYSAIALIFMMMMAFTLAKTVRDNNPTVIDGLGAEAQGADFAASSAYESGPRLAASMEPADAGTDVRLPREAVPGFVRAKKADETKAM